MMSKQVGDQIMEREKEGYLNHLFAEALNAIQKT